MFAERLQMAATKSNPKRQASASGGGMCAGSSTPSSSMFKETDSTSTAPDDDPAVLASSSPLNCLQIPIPAAPQWRGLGPQTDSPIDRASQTNTKQAKGQRTQFVWISAGDGPSITCTSPTPPPSARRVPRRPPTLSRARDALAPPMLQLSPLACRPTNHHVDSEENDSISSELMAERREVCSDFAKPSGSPVEVDDRARNEPVPERPPAAGPSHRRTLADYDRTNARIRALNAELLPNPYFQRHSHPYRTPARRTQRSSVRYLNVPGAAVDALMAVRALRASEAKRRASSSGTGIVDISESESSEFESGDDEEEEEEEGPGRADTPGGTNSEAPEAGTPGEACSETRVCVEISCGERLEHLQAVGTASASAEAGDCCVSVAGPQSAIIDPVVATDTDADADGSPWQRSRTMPFVRDRARAAEEDRFQPGHLPVLLRHSTPTSTPAPLSTVPHRPGKKRTRAGDPDDIYGDRVHVETSEGLAREGKRRKASPGVSMSAT